MKISKKRMMKMKIMKAEENQYQSAWRGIEAAKAKSNNRRPASVENGWLKMAKANMANASMAKCRKRPESNQLKKMWRNHIGNSNGEICKSRNGANEKSGVESISGISYRKHGCNWRHNLNQR
jgi:hypothetical protein